jgi:hypothetical protein
MNQVQTAMVGAVGLGVVVVMELGSSVVPSRLLIRFKC